MLEWNSSDGVGPKNMRSAEIQMKNVCMAGLTLVCDNIKEILMVASENWFNFLGCVLGIKIHESPLCIEVQHAEAGSGMSSLILWSRLLETKMRVHWRVSLDIRDAICPNNPDAKIPSLSQGNALRVALGWPPKRNFLSLMEISLMMGAALDRMFKWFGLIVRRTT